VIAFAVPNLFLHAAMSTLCRQCGPVSMAAVGMVLVGLLVALEVVFARTVLHMAHEPHHGAVVEDKSE